jgi:hypothetical protein
MLRAQPAFFDLSGKPFFQSSEAIAKDLPTRRISRRVTHVLAMFGRLQTFASSLP